HDLARLAVAALRHLLGLPGDLQRMRLAAAQSFDGGDLLAGRVLGRGLAGAHRDAVEMHRAGTAQSRTAAGLGAGHLQLLADDPEQWGVVRRIDLARLTVDDECDHVSSMADTAIAVARALMAVRILLLLFGDLDPVPWRPSRSRLGRAELLLA